MTLSSEECIKQPEGHREDRREPSNHKCACCPPSRRHGVAMISQKVKMAPSVQEEEVSSDDESA